MSSPVLWGPNNLANNLQNGQLNSSGQLISYNGPKNYVNNSSIENGLTTGYSLGTVGTLTNGLPTGSPTFGSGASGNLALTATSSSPLAGNFSLSYASSTATTQGDMVATSSLPIDIEDQAKVLTFKFYYQAQTNPTNGNFSGTSSNSFAVAVYDVTNSSWLTSAGNFNIVQNSGVGICTGTCQTNSTTANVRLVIYNANASSGAITMYFDDIFLGPQTSNNAPAMSDWVSYTPTWSSAVTPPAIGNGTLLGFYRRVGDSVELSISLTSGTTTTFGSANAYTFTMPSGLVADTTKLAGLDPSSIVGFALAFATSSLTQFGGEVELSTTTTVLIRAEGGGTGAWSSTNPAAWTAATANQRIEINAKIPIVGWSSNSASSSDTDTRVIAFKSGGSATATVTSSQSTVTFSASAFDNAGGYSSGTGKYTVPVSGIYEISSVAAINATYTASQFSQIYIVQNAATINTGGIFQVEAAIVGALYVQSTTLANCVAGDTLFTQVSSTGSGPTLSSAQMNIKRLSGPAVITAVESMNASYSNTAGTAITNSFATIPFATKNWDSHNAFNGTQYVVPVSGKYRISAAALLASVTFTTSQALQLQFVQSGSVAATRFVGQIFGNGTSQAWSVSGTTTFNCQAGDILVTQLLSSTASTLNTGAAFNNFEIERIGN